MFYQGSWINLQSSMYVLFAKIWTFQTYGPPLALKGLDNWGSNSHYYLICWVLIWCNKWSYTDFNRVHRYKYTKDIYAFDQPEIYTTFSEEIVYTKGQTVCVPCDFAVIYKACIGWIAKTFIYGRSKTSQHGLLYTLALNTLMKTVRQTAFQL